MFFTFHRFKRLTYRMPHQIIIENEMIERCRSGSMHDFRKLVELISPFAFSVAFRMVGDEEQTKDIVQESMITVWKTMKKIKSPGSFMSWFYRIVINKCYDQLRKRKVNPELRADDKTWSLLSDRISENTIPELERRETLQIINILTQKLSPKQKAVFVLSDLEEMSNEEISLITGMSRTSVKANLHYARKRIGEMIEKHI
jgi:RNA polymerase sigma-70 factor (ECF subfamily)